MVWVLGLMKAFDESSAKPGDVVVDGLTQERADVMLIYRTFPPPGTSFPSFLLLSPFRLRLHAVYSTMKISFAAMPLLKPP